MTAEMSTIAQKWLKRLLLKFKDEFFGAIKCPKKFSGENFTGNDFLDHESSFWALEIYNSCQFEPINIENAIIKCLGITLLPRTVGV